MDILEIPEDKEGKIIAEFMNWYLDKHPEEMERIYRGMIDKLIESDCYAPESFVPIYSAGLASLIMADAKSIEKQIKEAIKDAECHK